MGACVVEGEVHAVSMVKMDSRSQIRGNVYSQDFYCSGSLVGDIVSTGHVILSSTAKVKGNLTATTLSIEEGAMIEGNLKVLRESK